MIEQTSAMTDLVFDLRGRELSGNYMSALWREAVAALPWLEAELYAGILPLRTAASEGSFLLPQRAKLVLRLPVQRAQAARALSGKQLNIAGSALLVGDAKERPLQAHPSLHAHMVLSAADEESFLAEVAAELRVLGVTCKWICGKHITISGERQIAGYSLVLHELKPQDSLRVQCMGLGGERRYGCGIFVPYKVIPNLD